MNHKTKVNLLSKSSCIAAIAIASIATASAQEISADSEENSSDIIIVTGSRIARPDITASVPVAVVSQERIVQSGAANIQDVLADLPSVGQNISRSSSNFQTTGNGVATVNLRNLDEVRTLVLVNGRRFVPGLPGESTVDLNTIPTDLIKQVDVITGGASAVYGSEAIAGVVNFVLDDKFTGLRMRAQTTVSDEGDAPRQLVSLTGGLSFADGAGHIVVAGQYDRDHGLRSRNRGFSAVDNPNRSSFAEQGLFSPTGTFGSGAATFTFDRGNNLKNYQGANIDGYNRNADRFLGLPVERWLGTVLANYEFSPAVTVFGEFTYAKSKSRSSLEPQAVAYTDLTYADGSPYAGIPITNPLIPAAIRNAMVAAGVTDLPFRRRSVDIFDRSNVNDRDTWRALGGLRGTLADRFKWEVYYSHGETKDYTASGTILGPNYVNALNAVAGPNGPVCAINADANPNNNDAACVPINIFGFNTVTPAAAAYVTNNGQLSTYDAKATQDVLAGSLSGELFSIGGASPISFAVGAEYRREKSSEDFDEATNLGLTLGNLLTDTVGKYNVKEAFGEVVAPIVEDKPLLHYLGVEAAVRFADYSTVGSVLSWKVGGEWAPTPDVRLRGIYAEATRAPNIGELYDAQSETFPAVVDPCDQRGGEGDNAPIVIAAANLPAACKAIPAIAQAANAGGFVYSTAQIQTINGFLGGNTALREEKAKTLTLGAVLTPRFVPALSMTVDYYDIKVKNAIGIIGQQTSLDECYNGSGLDLFCSNIVRNTQGYVTTVNALNLNTGSFHVRGIDVQLNYRRELAPETTLDLSVFWNRLLKQDQTSFPGGPVQKELRQLDCYECGRLGTGFRDKVNASVTLDWRNFKLNWRTTYMSSVADTIDDPDAIWTGAYWYHDAQLRIGVDSKRKYELYFGIDNIFDKKPPAYNDTNIVTYPGTLTAAKTYDLFGRMFYAGVDIRF